MNLSELASQIEGENWREFFGRKDIIDILDSIGEKIGSNDFLPDRANIFRAFHALDVTDIKIVIVGQDPYHGPGQANGFAFSVGKKGDQPKLRIPPSLRRIYKALVDDEKVPNFNKQPKGGLLESWVRQGVFLINSALTVFPKKPGSHTIFWTTFAQNLLEYISEKNKECLFFLWGVKAQRFARFLSSDSTNRTLLYHHPSPLARKPFNCSHFSDALTVFPELNWGSVIEENADD